MTSRRVKGHCEVMEEYSALHSPLMGRDLCLAAGTGHVRYGTLLLMVSLLG